MQINVDKRQKYLLGCSFGPDSMALFHLLLTNGYYFEVAHVNYGMRGQESDEETNRLKKYCLDQKIPFHLKRVNPSEVKGNFQAFARDVRYTFFLDLLKERKLSAILTAHHLDDHLETYLMQKKQNKKTLYYGIKVNSVFEGAQLIRPLLDYPKSEIINYCKTNNVPYGVDSSNESQKYERNVIRKNVVNKLTRNDKEKLIKEIARLNSKLNVKHAELSALFNDDKIMLNSYKNLTEEERDYILYLLLLHNELVSRATGGVISNLKQALDKPTNSLMFKIHGKHYFVKAYDYFTIVNIKDYEPYAINVKEPMLVKAPRFRINLLNKRARERFKATDYPLTITTADVDDTYEVAGYMKKIKRMYVDMKMPRHIRMIWPIVKDHNGKVVYVPRYRVDHIQRSDDLFEIYT